MRTLKAWAFRVQTLQVGKIGEQVPNGLYRWGCTKRAQSRWRNDWDARSDRNPGGEIRRNASRGAWAGVSHDGWRLRCALQMGVFLVNEIGVILLVGISSGYL